MIRLTENVLSSSLILLERVQKYDSIALADLEYSGSLAINVEDIYAFASKCGWIEETGNSLSLTGRGNELIENKRQGLLLKMHRAMLLDYVLQIAPIWSNRIVYGRKEAAIFMSSDEKECFVEAGLLDETIDGGIVSWWDSVAREKREQEQKSKELTGRLGEKMTIEYEKLRTGVLPKWMAIESNLLGYDIESRKSRDDETKLLIEVKASGQSMELADFFITSNEWRVANSSKEYLFYLWHVNEKKKSLAILSPHDVQPHVPEDRSMGEWITTRIPFSCFGEKFCVIE